MSLTREDIVNVKGRGFLINRGTEMFSGRVVSKGGVYSAEQISAIAKCASEFGSGTVAFTSRLAAEITGIPFDRIAEAEEFIKPYGLAFGGTGAKVRPITACKGTTCVYGNIDTRALAETLHDRFYEGMKDVKLPHKFKIGVGGCPNSCMKPNLNDFGVEGCKPFTFDESKCRGCKVCSVASVCPSKAVSIADGKPAIDTKKCLSCGVCIGKCPFGAIPKQAQSMCKIYVGGTWGKSVRIGTPLKNPVCVEDVPALVEKAIMWYKANGLEKERFGKTIDRVGFDEFEKAIT